MKVGEFWYEQESEDPCLLCSVPRMLVKPDAEVGDLAAMIA